MRDRRGGPQDVGHHDDTTRQGRGRYQGRIEVNVEGLEHSDVAHSDRLRQSLFRISCGNELVPDVTLVADVNEHLHHGGKVDLLAGVQLIAAGVAGRVDVTDAIAILAYLFSGGDLACEDAGDANDNGGVNISDPIYLLGYLFSNGPVMPPPYPDPGDDPTPDVLDCEGPIEAR